MKKMKGPARVALPILALLVTLLLAQSAWGAGVALFELKLRDRTVVVMTIIDHPDPIGGRQRSRSVPAPRRLDAAVRARSGELEPDTDPIRIWSHRTGMSLDVVFSEWNGRAWTRPEPLTTGPENERDPSAAVAGDGTVHAAWWTDGDVPAIHVRTRPAWPAFWGPVTRVTPAPLEGRRPVVSVLGDRLRVIYEQTSNAQGSGRDIVVATRMGSAFGYEVVGTTAARGPLDVSVRLENGNLVVEWNHLPGEEGTATLAAVVPVSPGLPSQKGPKASAPGAKLLGSR